MAPPRGSLCRTLWFGTVIAVLTLLFLCSYDSVPVPTTLRLYAHDARRATTLEQLLYREEERYGKVVAMREELVVQAGIDETRCVYCCVDLWKPFVECVVYLISRSVPNRTTLRTSLFARMFGCELTLASEQLYPASFHCPYPLTLVGTSWICDLERIADSGRCGVYTVGPRDDLFTTSFLQAAPGCRTTTYTPGPQKFGNGRVYTSASGGWQTGGRGWIGISPVAEWPTPAPMGEPKLVQQPRGCGGDPLCEQKSGSGYTLEQLLRRSSHARNVDVLRVCFTHSLGLGSLVV